MFYLHVSALLRYRDQLLLPVHVILSVRSILIFLLVHVLKYRLERCLFGSSIWFCCWKLGCPFVMASSACVGDISNKKLFGDL